MSLLKKIRKFPAVRRLAASLIAQYVRLVWLTNKCEYIGQENPAPYWQQCKPIIACFWHGRLLMMLKSWHSSQKLHMLQSAHPDGEIMQHLVKKFGFGSIVGSSSKGGKKAFLQSVKALKNGGAIGVTPDGPRGPRYQASLGIIVMARLGGVSILPASYSSTRGIFIRSWDRFFLPLPFGRIVVMYGPPIETANSSKSDEELRQALEDSLKDLTQKADLYCGQKASE